MAGKRSNKQLQLRPRFRVVRGKDIALGPGKVELLAAVAKTRSLREAAQRLKMSYMRAWMLVNTMNKCFREPVVVAARGGSQGGGMKVTETGRQALDLYHQIESAALVAVRAPWRRLEKLLKP